MLDEHVAWLGITELYLIRKDGFLCSVGGDFS